MKQNLYLTYILIFSCMSLFSCADSDSDSNSAPEISIAPPTYPVSWAEDLPRLSSITCYEKTEELNIGYVTFEKTHTFNYQSNLLQQYAWEESYSFADVSQVNQQTHTLTYLPLATSLPNGATTQVIVKKADSYEQLVYLVNDKGQALTCNYFTGNEADTSAPSRVFTFAYDEAGYMTKLTQEISLPSGNLKETILTFDYTDGLLQEVSLYMSDEKGINSKDGTLVNTFTFGYDDDNGDKVPNDFQLPPTLYFFELYPLNFHTEAMMGHLLGQQSTLMCNSMRPKGNDNEKWYYHYRTDSTTGQLLSITQSGEIERTVNIEIR